LQVNDKFLFSASSPGIGDDTEARKGLALGHAYSILGAVEAEGEDGKTHRLVKIRYFGSANFYFCSTLIVLETPGEEEIFGEMASGTARGVTVPKNGPLTG
jgi:hypothetical protein